MGSECVRLNGKSYNEYEEKQKDNVLVFDELNEIIPRNGSVKSADSFIVVDMERLSPEKEINANSRVTLQRTLSRKATTSPRAALQGICTPEKALPVMVMAGAALADHPPPHSHHQITITTSNEATSVENKLVGGKRLSFRRSPTTTSWTIDPRRILLFFATLSSIGTILLIYFTLLVGKLGTDENTLN